MNLCAQLSYWSDPVMLLKRVRFTVAGIAAVVAVCASSARSSADVQILVEELNASSTVVGSSAFSVGVPAGTTTFFQNFNYSTPNGYFTLTGSTGTNSQLGTLNASLSTSFTGGFTSNFDASQLHSLRITVTDDHYLGNGNPTGLINSAGAALGFEGGTISVNSFSSVLNPNAPSSIPASSTTQLATGPLVGGPTPTATDSLPVASSNLRVTQSTINSLPTTYALQQVILISFNQTSTIDTSSTFAGSAGARIDPSAAVPAPGGLALAGIGLPIFGLRRLLRKRPVG